MRIRRMLILAILCLLVCLGDIAAVEPRDDSRRDELPQPLLTAPTGRAEQRDIVVTAETITVSLPCDHSKWYGQYCRDEEITVPNGRPIYAFLVSGFHQNRNLDMFHFYNFAKCLQSKGAYVHYAWWNNLLSPYMKKPLHNDNSVPSIEGFPNDDINGFLFNELFGLVPTKAVPAEDYQFQQDAEALLDAIRAENEDALIVLVGHSMGGDAIVRLAERTNVDIALLAPIDPVGNRTCLPTVNGNPVTWLNNHCWGWLNFTRYQATHQDGFLLPAQITFKENVKHLYHRWQQEFNPPFDYGCPGGPPLCLSGIPAHEYEYLVGTNCVSDQARMTTRSDSGYEVPVSLVEWRPLANEGGYFDGHGELVGFRGVVGTDLLGVLESILNEFLNPWEWDMFNVESFPLALNTQGEWPNGWCDLQPTSEETRPERCREHHMTRWEDDPNYLYKRGFEPYNPGLCMVSRDLCNILDSMLPEAANLAPTADAGPDQTVPADDDCVGQATLDGTASTDPEGDELTYTWTWNDGADQVTGPDPIIELPLGSHEITLVVSDGEFDSDPDTVVITVVDLTPPLIELEGAAEMVLECAVDSWEDAGAFATDNCDPDVVVSVGGDMVDPSVPGTYTITYDAMDASGNAALQVTRAVVVQDTLPPTFENVTANPAALWPPNHSMVPVQLTVAVHDFCDATPDILLMDVTSDEPDDAQGGGDGHTTGDIQNADIGAEDYIILLRAERQGGGDGRIYTIVYSATDDSGNSAGSGTIVTVGHDNSEPPVPQLPKRRMMRE